MGDLTLPSAIKTYFDVVSRAMSSAKVTQLHVAAPICPLPVGSPVALRGGVVVMTVTDEFEPMHPSNRWFVKCCWQNDVGDACSENYPVAALYEVEDEVEGRAVALKEMK